MKKNRVEEIRELAQDLGLGEEETIALITYDMEQSTVADEMVATAVRSGIVFSVEKDSDVFINIKWIGTILQLMAERVLVGGELSDDALKMVEVLTNSVTAAQRFVGSE